MAAEQGEPGSRESAHGGRRSSARAHRRYLPGITRQEKPTAAIEEYETFDRGEDGWLKTVLDVA
ncbi:hypothetical protein [Amycolatopsis sp. DSM 110486]|uniref:hypothetical protein n=1 Tax=Amycolatopsis sp. DSM 110486 TaxID=2865832 RepID=UPI001C699DE5|nr:hypothetical protein [Amycolatopsis sp. DSM 110486]QYN19129.1 hypothetical protein K1T34_41770 [Amycolatopsis sp. DSM 110486]